MLQLPAGSQSHSGYCCLSVVYLLLLLCRSHRAIQQGSETVLIRRVRVALHCHPHPGNSLHTSVRVRTTAQETRMPKSGGARPAVPLEISNRRVERMDAAHRFDLPLHRSIEGTMDLRTRPSPCRFVHLHDRFWPHRIFLPKI